MYSVLKRCYINQILQCDAVPWTFWVVHYLCVLFYRSIDAKKYINKRSRFEFGWKWWWMMLPFEFIPSYIAARISPENNLEFNNLFFYKKPIPDYRVIHLMEYWVVCSFMMNNSHKDIRHLARMNENFLLF